MQSDIEINDVWQKALRGMQFEHYRALLHAGLTSAQTARLFAEGAFGALSIAVKNGRWYENVPGDAAIVVPACRWFVDWSANSGWWEIYDLVAFPVSRPRSFWRSFSNATVLGQDSVERAIYDQKPLVIHETPLDWLCDDRDGVVILDWQDYWPLQFREIPALQFANPDFARRAMAQFERPFTLPPAVVPRHG